MGKDKVNTGCCCGTSGAVSNNGGCCDPDGGVKTENNTCCSNNSSNAQAEKRKLLIEFLYLDLSVCTRCQGTGNSLEEAIHEVAQVLKMTGIDAEVRNIHIETAEQALAFGFVSSPTIRINGHDIQLDVKETLCESCGDLCGDEVDCRVWVYQGKEYTVPPKAMIIEAILREVYGNEKQNSDAPAQVKELPENLKRFFAAKQKKSNE